MSSLMVMSSDRVDIGSWLGHPGLGFVWCFFIVQQGCPGWPPAHALIFNLRNTSPLWHIAVSNDSCAIRIFLLLLLFGNTPTSFSTFHCITAVAAVNLCILFH